MRPAGPFDTHAASATALEERARELIALAEQAGDRDVVTAAAFQPAVASWDGVAAPELRAAPDPARQLAGQVASQLSWAAVPLRFWAEQVRRFNATVGELQERRAQVPADVERHLRAVFGEDLDMWPLWELDSVRLAKRQELIGRLERRWREAYATYVDEGERIAVRMLQHGPTWENVLRARELGSIPAGPMPEFFAAGWSRAAALAEASRIAGLITGGSEPTVAELERFVGLLARYAGDDEFAYRLLTGLGPDGLLTLTGTLGLTGREGSGREWQQALGAVQRGLAVVLATATRWRGTGGDHARWPYQPGEFELPAQWVYELTRAGRQELLLGEPPVQIYGYQPLGVLLGHGHYDDGFLATVGGDLIDFELEQGGSEFWDDGVPALWLRLDWTGGAAGTDQPAGLDPMIGLLEALADHPEATRDVFTSRVLHDGSAGAARLPRLDYLLTDRVWQPDRIPGPGGMDHPGHADRALASLGAALEGATTLDPDQRSYRIVESIIYEIANDEQARGYPNGQQDGPRATLFRDVDIVHDTLRPALGRIGAFYIDDLHWKLVGFDAAVDTPDEPQLNRVNPRDLKVFLADLGKNAQARDTVAAAEYLYTPMLYHHYLTGWDGTANPLVLETQAVVTGPATRLLAALDFGAASELRANLASQDTVHNGALRQRFFWAGLAGSASHVLPSGGGPVGYVIQEQLAQLEQDLTRDTTGAANYYVGDLRESSRLTLEDMINQAAYRAVTSELTPERLLARVAEEDTDRVQALLFPDDHPNAGEFIPMPEWGDAQREAWSVYVTTPGNGGPAVLVDQGLRSYSSDFEAARGELEGDSHTGLPQ